VPTWRRFGGNDATEQHIRATYPGIDLTVVVPSMGYVKRRAERRQIVRAVLSAAPDLVLICTGAPSSEILAHQLRRAGSSSDILCCGAAIEFLAGRKSRAPTWVQNLGFEWLWRAIHEPHTRSRYLADIGFLAANRAQFVNLRTTGSASFAKFILKARTIAQTRPSGFRSIAQTWPLRESDARTL